MVRRVQRGLPLPLGAVDDWRRFARRCPDHRSDRRRRSHPCQRRPIRSCWRAMPRPLWQPEVAQGHRAAALGRPVRASLPVPPSLLQRLAASCHSAGARSRRNLALAVGIAATRRQSNMRAARLVAAGPPRRSLECGGSWLARRLQGPDSGCGGPSRPPRAIAAARAGHGLPNRRQVRSARTWHIDTSAHRLLPSVPGPGHVDAGDLREIPVMPRRISPANPSRRRAKISSTCVGRAGAWPSEAHLRL